MDRRFVSNADVHNYIGKNADEFFEKFTDTREMLAWILALIEKKDDPRIKIEAKRKIDDFVHEMKHFELLKKANGGRYYKPREIKKTAKTIFDVLTTSSNNKHIIENIVEIYETKIKPLRGDGDKEFRKTIITHYQDIKKEFIEQVAKLGKEEEMSDAVEKYKEEKTVSLSTLFPTANPDTIGEELSNIIDVIIEEYIKEHLDQIQMEADIIKEELIQKILPAGMDESGSLLDYIEKQTNQNNLEDLVMKYMEQKLIEINKKSDGTTSVAVFKILLPIAVVMVLQSPINGESLSIGEEDITKLLKEAK